MPDGVPDLTPAIFLTSHVIEVVERLCDHAAIINEGRMVAEGVFVRTIGRDREYDKLEWLG